MGRAKRTLVVVAFTLVSCSSQIVPAATPTTNSKLLRLYATTPTIPLVNELTTAYTEYYPAVSFDVATGNYESVVEHVLNEENTYFITNHLPAESPLVGFPIGQDGIAVIVHPDLDIAQLTTSQLREIYQGRVENWQEVGGPDQPLVVISRESGSGTRAEFERLVMGERTTTSAAQIAPSSVAMMTSVGRTHGAIGYVSASYLDSQVRAVAVNGIEPTLEHIYDNSYPLRSLLYIVGSKEPQDDDYRAFIGWVQSPEGQAVVARKYAPMLLP